MQALLDRYHAAKAAHPGSLILVRAGAHHYAFGADAGPVAVAEKLYIRSAFDAAVDKPVAMCRLPADTDVARCVRRLEDDGHTVEIVTVTA